MTWRLAAARLSPPASADSDDEARALRPGGAVATPPDTAPGAELSAPSSLRPCSQDCAEPELRCPLRDLLRCF